MKIICLSLLAISATSYKAKTPPTRLRQHSGVVFPIESSGTAIQLRIEECEGAPPCTIIPGRDTLIEGDFMPGQDSPLAYIRIVAETSLGAITVLDEPLGALTAGLTYTASQTIRISSALSGQGVNIILNVYDRASGRVEICVLAPMNIGPGS